MAGTQRLSYVEGPCLLAGRHACERKICWTRTGPCLKQPLLPALQEAAEGANVMMADSC